MSKSVRVGRLHDAEFGCGARRTKEGIGLVKVGKPCQWRSDLVTCLVYELLLLLCS